MHNADPLTIFRTLTTIPRDSGDEKRIAEYLVSFAKARGLEVVMDDVYNVIIRKPATVGYEDSPIVVLQSHSDMVYVKSGDSSHDYNSPLKLIEQNGFLCAEGTSLGADNGIGMAFSLAILDSTDLSHPPLEVLFTAGEETGMEGVNYLAPSALAGRRMINLDSEWEGVYTVGCAGGVTSVFCRKADWETVPSGCKGFKLTIQGLMGGHSGVEIEKGRGNAIRMLARVVYAASSKLGACVSTISGGDKGNAIPAYSEAVLFIDDESALNELVEEYNTAFRYELSASDKNVCLSMEPWEEGSKVLTKDTLQDILTLLLTIPVNVQTMSMHLKGLVESSNNIGILRCDEDAVTITCSIRSSVCTLKEMICDQMIVLAHATHAEVDFASDYPEWAFAVDSPLRDKAVKVHEELYGKKPEIISIHAGLECGFFKELYPDMDIISTGPNLTDVHTCQEKLEVASAQRVYLWLVKLLAALKE
ncbi:MAG: aminoacyl-histidine dipeptidase [Emergencia sp.]|nr:aminoacyl-histidine dipeptidase [Emergencia sp.]